jgi:hypothetical protein
MERGAEHQAPAGLIGITARSGILISSSGNPDPGFPIYFSLFFWTTSGLHADAVCLLVYQGNLESCRDLPG